MTRLFIIRHGNTFAEGETPRRVGGKTDIPLVQTGMEQAMKLGQHFKERGVVPEVVIASQLARTQQTAKYMLLEMGIERRIFTAGIFNEINYGPDENKTEKEVLKRIGKKALAKWDKEAVPPPGWEFNPKQKQADWFHFSNLILKSQPNKTIMVFTSNGVARFAPFLTNDYEGFQSNHNIKLPTGGYGEMIFQQGKWKVVSWGIKP